MKYQKTAVMQMFYGENGNADSIKCSPEEMNLIDEVDSNYSLFSEKLKQQTELWELFEKYKDSVERLNNYTTDYHYAEGFKFGLLMGIEAGESKFCNE